MRTSIGVLSLLAGLAPFSATAASNSAYADATAANGATVITPFPVALNGSATDITGAVTETVVWSPLPSVSLTTRPVANGVASGYADFSYGFTVSDHGAVITTPVPIDLVGNFQLTTQQGQPGYVNVKLNQVGGVGAYNFLYTTAALGSPACAACTGSFAGMAQLSGPGSVQVTTLTGTIDMIVSVGTFNGVQGAGYLDPYLSIDPVWAASHPGFTLTTEAGIGNAPVTPVPEPGSWLLLGTGVAVIAWRCRQLQRTAEARG